jgi:BirA family transcriptional regulator, biotin operon repressor / biotin---[acetyl-CoA-carboxylase] ligase
VTFLDLWPTGFDLRRYDSIDSTNEQARRLREQGETGPLWIVAREQTAGRGRLGRLWVSQAGNLFATLLVPAQTPIAAELGFAAGLAAAEVASHYAPNAVVTLKWPNDVLLDGAKVAGILLEAFAENVLAIGIGINLATHPDSTAFPATSIAAKTGRAPNPGDALVNLARAMAAWYEAWRTKGFAVLKEAWLVRAAGLREPVKASLAGGDMEGIFEGLDSDGALLLRGVGGVLTRITAGEVFFLV